MRIALGRCGLTGAGATLLLVVRGRGREGNRWIERQREGKGEGDREIERAMLKDH